MEALQRITSWQHLLILVQAGYNWEKDVFLHLKEYFLYRMFQIQDLPQLSILGK